MPLYQGLSYQSIDDNGYVGTKRGQLVKNSGPIVDMIRD